MNAAVGEPGTLESSGCSSTGCQCARTAAHVGVPRSPFIAAGRNHHHRTPCTVSHTNQPLPRTSQTPDVPWARRTSQDLSLRITSCGVCQVANGVQSFSSGSGATGPCLVCPCTSGASCTRVAKSDRRGCCTPNSSPSLWYKTCSKIRVE